MEAKQCTRCDRAVHEHKAMSVEIRVPQIYEDDTTEYVTIRADVCCDCAYKPFREAVRLGHGQTHGVLFEVMDGVDPWDRW